MKTTPRKLFEILENQLKIKSNIKQVSDELVSFLTNKSYDWIYQNPDAPVVLSHNLEKVIRKLNDHMPLAYITGAWECAHIKLNITPDVLVPRPETCDWITRFAYFVKSRSTNSLKMIDIGTGSGMIAAHLKYFFPDATILATDISNNALYVAQDNLDPSIKLYSSNLMQDIPLQHFDVVVANLPYLPKDAQVDISTKHEPKNALFSGEQGIDAYALLTDGLKKYINKQTVGAFECDPSNANLLATLIRIRLGFKTETWIDFNNLKRVVVFYN